MNGVGRDKACGAYSLCSGSSEVEMGRMEQGLQGEALRLEVPAGVGTP